MKFFFARNSAVPTSCFGSACAVLRGVGFLKCVLIFVTTVNAHAQKINKDAESISVRLSLTGDLSENYQFAGPFGSRLSGEAESAKPKCAFSAVFRNVRQQKKNQIEINSTLECSVNQQINTFRPPAFFVNEKTAGTAVTFSYLSKEYKKIQVVISDLKISKKQAK